MLLYNIGIYFFCLGVRIAALFNAKARLWVDGRKGWKRSLVEKMDGAGKVVWIHSASLGEFEQGRPLIETIKEQHPDHTILLTFFSPSGYEIRKNYKGADYVCYLPADTPRNARAFMEIVKPKVAVFIKYEFWLNYLREAKNDGCRLFVVSAIFREDSVFFKWYGGAFRRALGWFERVFVQNDESKELLLSIGIHRVTRAGDTRFDRVAQIASSAARVAIVEKFAGNAPVLVAGSTWPPDEELIEALIEKNPDTKFVIAPHEIDSVRIEAMRSRLSGKSVRYTQCSEQSAVEDAQVMFIDTIGILSAVYRYGKFAYIGGGFGVGIHNTLEAATFKLPIAFGTNYTKFKEARDMVELGVARSVANGEELGSWFDLVSQDALVYDKQREQLAKYVSANIGATDVIMRDIFS